MKNLLFLFFIAITPSLKAANYYFSSTSGSDDRTSSEAGNPSTPWKTIGKLNSFFSSLQPGDSVLFKRGETFYGSITINKSGGSNLPIVIGSYGTGNKPVITSLITLSNWISTGNGISESSNPSLGSTVNMVLLNGVEQEMGRYPNSNAPDNGYLIFENHLGKTSITDNELTSAINWTGAELVIRPRRWILNRNLITSHSGGEISYTTSSPYEPFDKYGYFIQNSIKTLDKFGEWYYNPSAKKLSVYFGSGKSSSYVVQVTTKDNLISSDNFSNIVFTDLAIKGANSSGFNIRNGSNILIKNCDILFSGENGVTVNGHNNFEIENCTILNQNNNGLDIQSGNAATIKNNKILNTSLLAGMSSSGDNKGLAVYCKLNSVTIENNEIRNAGYIGIRFNGSDILVKNNFIDSFCVTKDDGGGIYTFTGSSPSSDYKRKIIGNIIMNGIGAGYGTDNPGNLPASGIYIDNNASNIEVTDNTVANCNNNGIYIHDAFGVIVKNNTLFSNNRQLAMIQDANKYAIRNNTITNNSFFAKLPAQVVSYFKSNADDVTLFGKFDSNYYAKPIDDRITIYNSYVKGSGGTVAQNVNLESWKKKYDKDVTSKSTTKQIAAYKLNKVIGSNKIANGTFTNNTSGVYTAGCTASLITTGGIDGGSLLITPTAKRSSIYIKIGGVTAGKKYILKYSVKGSVEDMTLNTFLRQGISPYASLTSVQQRPVNITQSENEMILVPGITEGSATIVFQPDLPNEYYLDNIQFYEADASITNIDDYIRFEYNPTKKNKTITLSGNYTDLKNNKYSNSIVLQPYTSVILMKEK